MGSSAKIWSFRRSFLYLCSYKLDGSATSDANEVQVAPMSSELCAEFERLNLGFVTNAMELVLEPKLEQEIRKGQLQDAKFKEIEENIVIGKAPGFRMDDNETL